MKKYDFIDQKKKKRTTTLIIWQMEMSWLGWHISRVIHLCHTKEIKPIFFYFSVLGHLVKEKLRAKTKLMCANGEAVYFVRLIISCDQRETFSRSESDSKNIQMFQTQHFRKQPFFFFPH